MFAELVGVASKKPSFYGEKTEEGEPVNSSGKFALRDKG